ncbi:four-carbon acid sugar kinase family protein [Neorhizobium alkalisoli]|uniref:four-carbon acid sugar kinase family protein n=1 Tax=Neorhizobium alkalisoli TaxID=528178 RepID=UPI000CF98D52|nr:four-carbon acid sugar kinase family protein [Neorhizobium alkalisoli]
MGLEVAIIADDLTGALDTSTPFMGAGLTVSVAIDVDNISVALKAAPDVLVVNTASRAMPAPQAEQTVRYAAATIATAKPSFVFKKIDSRLKGNVAIESEAVADVFGNSKLVIAPAVPDQQRFTRGGSVVGRGVEIPLPILPLFAGPGVELYIADAETDADLDRIVAQLDGKAVLVGARGLGLALARRLCKGRSGARYFSPSSATLFAIGSRDPITMRQMEALETSGGLNGLLDAPAGVLSIRPEVTLPVLIRCSGEVVEDGAAVADRFAEKVTDIIEATKADTVITGGGDTAHALLRALNVGLLSPKGELEPGFPWCELVLQNGRQIRLAIKSGGFGSQETLVKALAKPPETRRTL